MFLLETVETPMPDNSIGIAIVAIILALVWLKKLNKEPEKGGDND